MTLRSVVLAFVLLAQATADDRWEQVLLLQKVKRHIAEETKRLPDYTCLQTSARYRRSSAKKEEWRADKLVLEVLNIGQKEVFASPGSRAFEKENPVDLTAGGLTGTGSFGLFLRTLFVNDNAVFQYGGEEQFLGRSAIRWDYRVPRMMSAYTVRLEYAQGVVGMRGSFLVDPETLDLLWLSVDADDIPPDLPVVSAKQIIEYAPMRIGSEDVTLPQRGSLEIVEQSGVRSLNSVEFTHCRSFRAESALYFTERPAQQGASFGSPMEQPPLRPGLKVAIELAAPLTAAPLRKSLQARKQSDEGYTVGGLFEGRVVADVRDRGKTVVQAGAKVRGRIRRLERTEDGYWAVGLEFTEIATAAGPVRFYADIFELDDRVDAKAVLYKKTESGVPGWQTETKTEVRWFTYLPGVAQFYIPGRELRLPEGFRTVWKTTSP